MVKYAYYTSDELIPKSEAVDMLSDEIVNSDKILHSCATICLSELAMQVQKNKTYRFRLEEPALSQKTKLIMICGGTITDTYVVTMDTLQFISYAACLGGTQSGPIRFIFQNH